MCQLLLFWNWSYMRSTFAHYYENDFNQQKQLDSMDFVWFTIFLNRIIWAKIVISKISKSSRWITMQVLSMQLSTVVEIKRLQFKILSRCGVEVTFAKLEGPKLDYIWRFEGYAQSGEASSSCKSRKEKMTSRANTCFYSQFEGVWIFVGDFIIWCRLNDPYTEYRKSPFLKLMYLSSVDDLYKYYKIDWKALCSSFLLIT